MLVMIPMQHEGNKVNEMMTMMPAQQGQQRLCNVGNCAGTTSGRPHCDNGKDACTLMMAMTLS
jgi:hypothetical protein